MDGIVGGIIASCDSLKQALYMNFNELIRWLIARMNSSLYDQLSTKVTFTCKTNEV